MSPGGDDTITILITGGAGFIGSHLVDLFLNDGYDVTCLDNFDSYYDPAIKHQNIKHCLKNQKFKLIKGDITDKSLITDVLKDIDYIFHEAAQAGVQISVEDPFKPHSVNATGTLNLLDLARKSDVKKIINASSSSVYGAVKYLPFDENHPTTPVSPYGITKLAAEHYCRVFQDLYGLKSVSLRYFTVYGPRMRPDLAISIFTKKAFNNKTIEIFGDGTKTRDFTFIEDIVNANKIAMNCGEGAYNIGGGHFISIKELAEKIIGITKSKSTIKFFPQKKGDAYHTLADTQKAETELGWEPFTSIDSGLRRYTEWALKSA